MLDNLANYFETTGFMPHGHCFFWTPSLLWTYAVSDFIIAASYFSIPFALWYFVKKRPDVPFRWIFWMFIVIVLACGTTHLFAIWNIWHAAYWADAGLKALTASVSAATAILLWPLIPQALTIPSHRQLENANRELQNEVTRRMQAESALLASNEVLGRSVAARTAELQRANDALRESEARFRGLTEMSSDFYWESDVEHRITQRTSGGNPSTLSVYQQGAQIGKSRWDVPYLSPDEAGWQAHRALLDAHRPFRNFELSRVGTDGTEHFMSISGNPVFDASGAFKGYRGVGTDITERKVAELQLIEREVQYRTLADSGQALIWTSGADKLCDYFNKVWLDFTGRSMEQELGDGWSAGVHPDDLQRCLDTYGSAFDRREVFSVDYRLRRHDGEYRWIRDDSCPRYDSEGEFIGYIGYCLDITERKQAEQKTAESERHFRSLFENMLEGYAYCKMLFREGTAEEFVYLDVNHAFESLTGLKDVVGKPVSQVIPGIRESNPELFEIYARVALNGRPQQFETYVASLERWFSITAYCPEKEHFVAVFDDITARKTSQQVLADSEQRFRGLVEQSLAGIYIIRDGRFNYVNPRFAEIFGYASAGELIDAEWLSLVAERDRGIVAENMGSRLESGVQSLSYSFTGVRKDGSLIEIGAHGARATHDGQPAIIGLFQDIAEKKRAEEQIQHHVAQLENAFMSTVQVVTSLGEMRDPYTAGHQRRVAEIAVAIGAELGFDARRQEGLRVAGYLHDVGKIRIPSEILSKPGKLSQAEFQLVQGHAQASYDVLKDIEFPWLVAEVALQHHERMDGSGYPQGLKGEAILPEARIVSVADVIEAMSSHRPYRAGLGIVAALAEIERGRGSVYDTETADACLRLFREGRYQLPA